MSVKNLIIAAAVLCGTCFEAHALKSFAPLAEQLMPSVVNISTRLQNMEEEPGVVNDLLFSAPDGRVALGSGFIISADGYIVTNRHVIEKSDGITVVLSDESAYEAEVIGEDIETDLALIKIVPQHNLQPVEFGDSDKIRVGDWVLAIGNPFGLGSSVTAGIISAKSRDIDNSPYGSYLQTDAAINQGNSGGPMFNADGKLIGVNTAIFSTAGGGMGVGFALPSNQALWVASQLQKHGRAVRSWLGIAVKSGETGGGEPGLAVTEILNEELSQKNNLQAGDIVLSYNGKKARSAKDFSMYISQLAPQEDVVLKIWRNGEEFEQNVVTEIMPEKKIAAEIKELTDSAQQQGVNYPELGLTLNGLKVSGINDNSNAGQKGVKIGDSIVKAGGIALVDPQFLRAKIDEAAVSGEPLHLDLINFDGSERYFIELDIVRSDNRKDLR